MERDQLTPCLCKSREVPRFTNIGLCSNTIHTRHEIANITRAIITVSTMYDRSEHLSAPSEKLIDPPDPEQSEVLLLGVLSKWEAKMKELIDYKEKNGNCDVPQRESGLGIWVKCQRNCYKNRKLSQKRINQLEDIGFSWGILREKINQLPWEDRFKELDAYKEKNGKCSVPRSQGKLGN